MHKGENTNEQQEEKPPMLEQTLTLLPKTSQQTHRTIHLMPQTKIEL